MSARAARVLAQAKINVRLRVLARQADGYHELESIFARLAMGDDVRVRVDVPGRTLDCAGADVGPMERNLAWRAAQAMREAGGPDRFAIEIEKRIPVGGGLGGGSADAAAVLRALNALSRVPLDDDHLWNVARSLGADVPFLASDTACALGRGRGDLLTPLRAPPAAPVVLAVPPFGVATAEAYAWLAAARVGAAPTRSDDAALSPVEGWDALERLATNDFEPVVFARHGELAELRDWLRGRGARLALLAGSGSTVVGIFRTDAEADAALAQPPRAAARLIRTATAAAASPVELS